MQRRIRRWVALVLALGAMAAGSANSQAEGTAPTTQLVSTSGVYDNHESRLQALESRFADGGEVAPAGLQWTDTATQNFTVGVGGRVHGDYVLFADQDNASRTAYGELDNYFEMRRLRLFAAGEGYGVCDYKLEMDFSPNPWGEYVAMRDVYVGIHQIPFLGYVRFGNFKIPFSLENLTDSNFITFLERGLPNIFVSDQVEDRILEDGRKVGVCAYNHTPGQQFTVAYGAFFDRVHPIAKNSVHVGDHQGIDFVARGTWNPIYEADGRGVLHAGLGYVWADNAQDSWWWGVDDALRFTALPEINRPAFSGFVDTGSFPARDSQRINMECAMVYGPASLQGEFFYVHTNDVVDRDFYGAYVYGSFFLTGENRSYRRTTGAFGRVKPNTNFWLVRTMDKCCDLGWGAWELAFRWSMVDLHNADSPFDGYPGSGKLNDATFGLNWYWNPNTRLMVNYIHAWGDLDGFSNRHAATDTDIISMRMQVDF